ncbi:hypothetical protein BDQ17DRAFT_1546132 [Cyathus striatus]|nr:hypothetical protein BDQ17DRAFT_1546132 [Cyathus striatus]
MSSLTISINAIDTNSALASRYFTAAGFTLLLWDHLNTLSKEVDLIWRGSGRYSWMLKVAFLFNRYVHEGYMLFVVYVTSGIRAPSDDVCRSYLMAVVFFGTVATIIAQFLLILRLYVLMDQRRAVLYWLTAGFVIAVAVSLLFTILSMIDFKNGPIGVVPVLNVCVLIEKPRYALGILSPMCAFDVFVVLLSIYNALDRPYRSNAEFFTSLYKDGVRIFLGNAVLHLVDLLVVIFGSADKLFIILIFFCALSSVLISRLTFLMEKIENLKYGSLIIPLKHSYS